jgi:uncharacterized protein YdaU (DUF1376 family)
MTLPYYPFYWGDYSAKTFNLTTHQHGVYMLLLRHIYCTGERIPVKHRLSIAKARLPEEAADVDYILETYFTRIGDDWTNERAEDVMSEQHGKHQKLVIAGQKGGFKSKPRLSQAEATLEASLKPPPKQPEPEPNIVGLGCARDNLQSLEAKLREAAGWEREPHPGLFVVGPIHALIEAGADLEIDVLPTVKALSNSCRSKSGWKYFMQAIAQARDDRLAAGNLKVVPLLTNGTPYHGKQRANSIERATSNVQAAISARIAELEAVVGSDESGDESFQGLR